MNKPAVVLLSAAAVFSALAACGEKKPAAAPVPARPQQGKPPAGQAQAPAAPRPGGATVTAPVGASPAPTAEATLMQTRIDALEDWAGRSVAEQNARLAEAMEARQKAWEERVARIRASALSDQAKSDAITALAAELKVPGDAPVALEQTRKWEETAAEWRKAVSDRNPGAAAAALEKLRDLAAETPGLLAPFQDMLRTEVRQAAALMQMPANAGLARPGVPPGGAGAP